MEYLTPKQRRERRKRLEDLGQQITELAAHITASTYRLLVLIREYDEGGGWHDPGLRSCAEWLNWKCGISIGAAREKVRVAHALKDLPRISAAFENGSLSYSKVRAMTRVANRKNEQNLLDVARSVTASHMDRLVHSYRKVKRIEAQEQGERHHHERRLRWYVDDDGSFVFSGRLPPEQGAIVVKALEAAMAEVPQEISAEIYRDTEQQPEPEYPANAKRADALEKLAESYLSGRKEALNGGDRYLIHVHTTPDTLTRDGESGESELDHGEISAETSRRMSCDASLVEISEDEHGIPLDVGRKTRTIPPSIRRALKNRDGGCRFPGCCNTRYVDAHHIHHWADGGETKMSNLVLLCRYHHRLVHEGGFGVEIGDPSQRGFWLAKADEGRRRNDPIFWFTDKKGKIIPPAADENLRGDLPSIIGANIHAGLDITDNTPVPNWDGGEPDYNAVIQSMLYREQWRKPPISP